MEKTKFIFLISLFLIIDLFSCDPGFSPKCPKNTFIKLTYECAPCGDGQYLDLYGNCKCTNVTHFFNITDKKCYACPSDSTANPDYPNNGPRCLCTNTSLPFLDDENICKIPPDTDYIYYKTISGYDKTCRSDQLTIIERSNIWDPQRQDYYKYGRCVTCPEGSTTSSDTCECTEGNYNFKENKCVVCGSGELFSTYYHKCIKCEASSFHSSSSAACDCQETEYFNNKNVACMKVPDNAEKKNKDSYYYYNVRCKDPNSYLDLNTNECVACGENAVVYYDNAYEQESYCYCKDPTKEFDRTQKECVACGEHKARSELTKRFCDICTENHFKHFYLEEVEGELVNKFQCKKCPELSNENGCICKKTFETFVNKREKCFECGKGAHKSEETLGCVCDDEDEFYDNSLEKCRKCPKGAIPSKLPFYFDSSRETCVCPPNQIYDMKHNKCIQECPEGQTFGYECSPCGENGYSFGSRSYCYCKYGAWDYETETCKKYGEWSSSSYMKYCFGLILLILLL